MSNIMYTTPQSNSGPRQQQGPGQTAVGQSSTSSLMANLLAAQAGLMGAPPAGMAGGGYVSAQGGQMMQTAMMPGQSMQMQPSGMISTMMGGVPAQNAIMTPMGMMAVNPAMMANMANMMGMTYGPGDSMSQKDSSRARKRYNDDDDDDRPRRRADRDDRRGGRERDREGKDRPPSVDDVTLLFPLDGIGTVIGKGGNTIRRIQDTSRAGLKLQDPKTLPESATERGLTISGNMDQIIKAERMIYEQIKFEREELEKTQEDGEQIVKWLIPVDNCGVIIGRKGAGIDELKKNTGAYVRVATQFDMPPGSDERLVTIIGEPSCCQAALDYIKEKSGGKPFESRGWKTRSIKSTSGGSNSELVQVPLKSIGVILGTGGGEMKKITQESGAAVQISTDMFIGDTQRIVTISGDVDAREKAKEMLEERVEAWRREVNDSDEETTCLKMVIPYALIGHVLGKGGSFMREISNSCNVSVKINQERGSFHRLCDSRPVMMIGTLENIFEAQRQIMDRIRSAPRSAVEEYQKFNDDYEDRRDSRDSNSQPAPKMMMMPSGMGGIVPMMMNPMMMGMGGGMGGMMPMPVPMGGMGGGMSSGGMSSGGMGSSDIVVRENKHLGINGVREHKEGIDIWINPICIKYIIGKGGTMIKQLARQSRCEINAQEKDEVKPNQNGVMISLRGSQAQVLDAFKLIEDTLSGIKDSLNPLKL